MKRILYNLILFFLLFVSVKAQKADTVTLNGMVVVDVGDLPSKSVKLIPYSDSDKSYDSEINEDGSFNFKISVIDLACYQLQYCGYVKNILFSNNEKSIGFLIEVESGKPSKMFISNSPENVAYESLKNQYNGLSDVLKKYKKDLSLNQGKWISSITAFNAVMMNLAVQYPNTITTKLIVPLVKFPDIKENEYSAKYVDQHYFDEADFLDERIFKLPELSTKFIYYLNYFADTTAGARIGFIKRMFGKAKDVANAKSSIGLILYNLFTRQNLENYLLSYSKWLEFQPWSKTELPVVFSRLAIASKVLPGSEAPNIEGSDTEGKIQILSDLVKSGKLTLVLFWSSECSHCIESMPEIKKIYNRYHNSGFNIYAVSLEERKDSWVNYVKANKLPWTNVYSGSNSSAATDYYVQATPSFAFIDSKGIVITRFMDSENLQTQIEDILKR